MYIVNCHKCNGQIRHRLIWENCLSIVYLKIDEVRHMSIKLIQVINTSGEQSPCDITGWSELILICLIRVAKLDKSELTVP